MDVMYPLVNILQGSPRNEVFFISYNFTGKNNMCKLVYSYYQLLNKLKDMELGSAISHTNGPSYKVQIKAFWIHISFLKFHVAHNSGYENCLN